jgi:hypothetical protein
VSIFVAILFFPVYSANAQTTVPRFQFGTQFTALRLPSPIGESAAGLGGHFGYNISNYFGVEADVNHFPGGNLKAPDFGETQGLFGLKAGYGGRYGGIFAKVRPGFIHFAQNSATVGRGLKQQDYFSMDVGIVAERYFQNHVYLRFDAGDTIIAYGGEHYLNTTGTIIPLQTTHNFQATIGVGLHF